MNAVLKPNETELPIFICYRQADGSSAAKWLHERLHGKLIESGGTSLCLNAYLDTQAAAVSDWKLIHLPSLQRAKALIFIVTPGSFANFGADDWVHHELDWWIQNRSTAPILIDATAEGERWIPDSVKNRWRDLQRVVFDPHNDATLRPIVDGILLSGTKILFDDLGQQRKVIMKYRGALLASSLATVAAICVAVFAFILNARITASYERISGVQSLLDQSADLNLKVLDANLLVLKALVGDEHDDTARANDDTQARKANEPQVMPASYRADSNVPLMEFIDDLHAAMAVTNHRMNRFESLIDDARNRLPELEALKHELHELRNRK